MGAVETMDVDIESEVKSEGMALAKEVEAADVFGGLEGRSGTMASLQHEHENTSRTMHEKLQSFLGKISFILA